MSFFSKLAAAFMLIMISATAWAQVRVEVTEGAISEYNMAVSPIAVTDSANAGLAEDLATAIERVFDITGYFKILDKRSFLEKPEVDFAAVDFKSWTNVGANGLVKGKISGSSGDVDLDLAFYDVSGAKQLFRKKYTAPANMLKTAAYRFTAEVIKTLTGEEMTFMFSKIAFVEKNGHQYNLVVTNFDGSGKKVIHSTQKTILLPEWSADGTKIYFTSHESNNPNLYVIDIKSKKITLVSAYEGLNTSASAHSDNKTVSLCLSKDGNSEIYSLDTETKALTRLTTNSATDTAPTVNSAGTELAFVSNRAGNPQIYKLSLSNPANVERLTDQGKYNQDPEFSPDGKKIAFSGRDEFYKFDIFVINLETRVIERVTQNQGKNESPTFSPDSRIIAFSSNRDGKNKLYLSNVAGTKQFAVYSGEGEVVTPTWSQVTNQ